MTHETTEGTAVSINRPVQQVRWGTLKMGDFYELDGEVYMVGSGLKSVQMTGNNRGVVLERESPYLDTLIHPLAIETPLGLIDRAVKYGANTFWAAAVPQEDRQVVKVTREVKNRVTEARVNDPCWNPPMGEWRAYGDSGRIPKGALRSGPYATRNIAEQVARDLNALEKARRERAARREPECDQEDQTSTPEIGTSISMSSPYRPSTAAGEAAKRAERHTD